MRFFANKKAAVVATMALVVVAIALVLKGILPDSNSVLPMSKPWAHMARSLPPQVMEVRKRVVEAKDTQDSFQKITQMLGEYHRITGSGIPYYEWDVESGVIHASPDWGPVFIDKKGVHIPLRPTKNRIAENLLGGFEFMTRPSKKYYRCWVGNVEFLENGTYHFRGSGTDVYKDQDPSENFFIQFPNGVFEIHYALGLTKDSLLEEIADDSVIARLDFNGQSSDGADRQGRSFFIRSHHKQYRHLTLDSTNGRTLPYIADRCWEHYVWQ